MMRQRDIFSRCGHGTPLIRLPTLLTTPQLALLGQRVDNLSTK